MGVGYPESQVDGNRDRDGRGTWRADRKVCTGVSSYQDKYKVYRPGASNSSILVVKNEQYYPCCCEKMLNVISD